MDFKNRLKGNITQTLVETLLEDVKYRIVPLGIEEVIREVSCLEVEEYRAMELPMALRKLPDFFISNSDMTRSWLVEVKYRGAWNEEVRDLLGRELIDQVRQWAPVYVVIFIGEAIDQNDTPSAFVRVFKAELLEGRLGIVKIVDEGVGLEKRLVERFIPWGEVQWWSFNRFQDVFTEVAGRWGDDTIAKAIEIMRSLQELV